MKVSICTSVLNQSVLLKGMIASVVGQSFKDWELIIVDDGSTEDIAAEVAYWNDPRIVYERLPENRGVLHGLNHAFSLAAGDYVQPLSADERIDLNKLLWQVGYLDEHPEIAGIWGLPENGALGERPEWEQYALKAHNRSQEAWIRTLLNLESIPIGGASWLVRRAVLDDIGYFASDTGTCSDLELFVRFFEKYEGRVFPYRWAWCEENASSISNTTTGEQFQQYLNTVRARHPLKIPPTEGRVTVAIPVRNMAQFIPATLKSLHAQTFQDFDIMILDDASTDDTVETVQICALEYPGKYTFIKLTENIGPNAAQNHMLGQCQTPFFVVLAADDTVEPTFLERCLAEFAKNPWLEFVGTQTDFMDKDANPVVKDHPFTQIRKAHNKPREVWLQELYYGNQYFGCGMYRTQAIKDLGGWDASVGVLGDYDMYLKLLQRENIHVIEETLTHTRIHDANRSIGKDRQWTVDLRNHYHTIRLRYWKPRMKVVIATAFYNMNGFAPYISSLQATIRMLTLNGIEHEYWELSGDSYVDRAKNTIFNKFLEDPEATDIFMIDSDMQWNAQAFLNMLMIDQDIVMASYPQKNMWEMWTAMPLSEIIDGQSVVPGQVLPDGGALIKAAALAGGFIKIRRGALEKYKEAYGDKVYYDPGADPNYTDRCYTEFFTCERALGPDGKSMLRFGEDRVFGRRMQEIGVQSYIYTNVDVGHYGIKGWTGNYHKYLEEHSKPKDAA